MKNQTLIIGLKWAAIQAASVVCTTFILAKLFESRVNVGAAGMAVSSVSMFILQFVFFFFAIRELERKNGSQMTAQKPFELGGWFLAAITIFNCLTVFVTMQLSETSAMGRSSMSIGIILGGVALSVFFQLFLMLIAFTIYGIWRIFTKAGKPGWASIVPVYNAVVQCEIGQRPTWWVIMLFIPFVNIIFGIMIINGISKAFGKDEGFTAGMVLLPFVFYPMLGFGEDRYIYGPAQEEEAYHGSTLEDHLVE